jgi:hypothetical protein
MGKPNSKKDIAERREKILSLLSKGYSQGDICKELNVTRQTISKDMKWINESTQRGLFGLAKETLSTMFFSCIESNNQLQKECWKIYRNDENNPEITQWHRMKALSLLRRINESKFNMFTNGPAFMEIHRLQEEITRIKDKTFDQNGNFVRPLTDKELDDLDKP